MKRELHEAWADAVHELRAARSLAARARELVAGAAAVGRVAGTTLDVFEEAHPMRHLIQDVRYALRRLRAAPVFALFAVGTLAVGIGATTAIYSVVLAFLAPPSGIADPAALVSVTHSEAGSVPIFALSYPDFEDFRAQQTAFERVAGWSYFRQTLSANAHAETAFGEIVTGDYFQVLGVHTAIGRPLVPADDRPDASPAAVISYGVWQRFFGGSPDAVGRPIKMNGETFEIVGVAPRDFTGLFNSGIVASAMWVPFSSGSRIAGPGMSMTFDREARERRWVQVRARLAPGKSLIDARTDVTRIATELDRAFPIGQDLAPQFRVPYMVSRRWMARPITAIAINESAGSLVRPIAATFMVAVTLVLLVACTNLANLLLARGAARRSELSVRLALGASRWRLIRVVLMEAAVLAGVGGIAGIGAARTLLIFASDDIAVGNGIALRVVPHLDMTVLALSAAATLLALLVAGVVPALQSTRLDLRSTLASGGSHAALVRWRGRRLLIEAQVTISMVLICVGALCLAQLRAASRVDTGIDLDHLAVAEIDLAALKYDASQGRALVATILDRLRSRGAVDAVAASSGLPFGTSTPGAAVGVADPPRLFGSFVAGTPDLFRALDVAIRLGRAFDARDAAGSQPSVVISEATALTLFGRADAVGQTIFVQRRQWAGESAHPVDAMTIVGVAADTDTEIAGREGGATVYLPFDQHYEGRLSIVARTSGDPALFVGQLREAIASADPNVAPSDIGTGPAVMAPQNVFVQVTAALGGMLGLFALLLALAGLYGVLSHLVARRTREIGLRVALGAERRTIVWMVVRDGLRPIVGGIGVGLALGALARMLVQPMFSRLLPAIDPLVLTMVPALMLAAGVVACYVPARRAARVDPNVALRDI